MLWRRLKYLLPWHRRNEDRDVHEELQSLRAMAEPNELGNLTLAAENARAVWGWSWLENTVQDVRYGFRTLVRNRRVTAIALLSLALGIAANTLVFSFVEALLLRPLPYPDPDRLVLISSRAPNNPQQLAGLSRADCVTLHESSDVFEDLGCYTDPVSASIADSNSTEPSAEQLVGRQITAGSARALGVHPLLGKWFTDEDEREGADRVLLISFALWQGRFGADTAVVGKAVRFNGEPATIIGVLPRDYEFLDLAGDYWTPFQNAMYGRRSPARILGGMARLRPDISLPAAQARMDAVACRLAEEFPTTHRGWGIALRSFDRLDVLNFSFEARNPLMILQGAVAFVLLIACANAAGLLLAQGSSQHREVAVRAALGASRWRVFRQLLTHSVLLSFGGGALGLCMGLAGVRLMSHLLSQRLPAGLPPAVYEMPVDSGILLFTLGISILSGLIVGITPAFQISHAQPLDAMRESSRSSTAGRSRRRLRSVFVVGQLALALTLLVGTGLLLNSLIRLARDPLGFDPNNLVTVQMELPEGKFRRPTSQVLPSGALEMAIDPQMYRTSEQIRENLANVPGVTAASGIAIFAPFRFSGSMNMPVRIEGKQAETLRAQFLPIMPDYFMTLQVRVVHGREFTSQDLRGTQPVAVINQAVAQRLWPNETAIGNQLQIDSPLLPNQPIREVVGVVEEVMQYPGQQSRPQLYIPFLQLSPEHDERLSNDLRRMTFIVRRSGDLPEAVPAIQAAVSQADNSQAISNIRTMRDNAYHSLERRRIYVGLLGAFGVIAVLLASLGVYGAMAQVVSQRTNEIGVRMALGADRKRVRLLVIRQGGLLVGIGLLLGTVSSLALMRLIRTSLFGIEATDPLTFAIAAGLLGVIALIACYLPARRASRIDPMLALRHE
jgi:putative ABC transport system permease protein